MLQFALTNVAGTHVDMEFPAAVDVRLRMNDVSTAELTFDDDDPRYAKIQDGFRIRCMWNDTEILKGTWSQIRRADGQAVVTFTDDWWLFRNLLWAKPAAAITAQSDEFRLYTGNLETATRTALGELSTRLGLGWTFGTNHNLGPATRVEARFEPFVDLFIPRLNAAKLRLSLTNGEVNISEGALFPETLTLDSGVIEDYEYTITAPTTTRVVVGGEGQGNARVFRQYINTGLEAVWGKREVFTDARLANGVTDFTADAAVTFADGARKVAFSAELNDRGSDWFVYPAYQVGDRVPVAVGPVESTEVITQIHISDNPGNGLSVKPTLGFADASTDRVLTKQLNELRRQVRELRSTR